MNDTLRLADVLKATGVTYRQLDYWTRQGWVTPAGPAAPGSGRVRDWDPAEVRVVTLLGRLVAAGIAPPVAARVVRELVENGWSELLPASTDWPALEVVTR